MSVRFKSWKYAAVIAVVIGVGAISVVGVNIGRYFYMGQDDAGTHHFHSEDRKFVVAMDDDEVTDDATLMGDLGAESIDFLDIVFRLEKTFDVKIPREELFPAESLMNNPEYVSNGKLTETGLAELKSKMPHTDITEFQKDPDINKLGDLFTVNAIVNYVSGKLEAA